MVCKNCGTYNDDAAKFCASCGADLSLQNADDQAYTPANQAPICDTPAQEPNYNYAVSGQNQTAEPEAGKGLAIASMVCGIVSLLCFALITGTLGIVFGAIAKSKGCKSGMATAGIICGIIGVGLWLIMLLFGFSLASFGL